MSEAPRALPYIPNSVPRIKREMLDAIGVADVEELYRAIPDRLRVPGLLDLPAPLVSEHALRRHVEGTLSQNEN